MQYFQIDSVRMQGCYRTMIGCLVFINFLVASKMNARYELLDQIANGGQGSILNAIDKRTNQPVAIKRINILGTHSRLAFEAEFRAMTKLSLKIPNVCKIEDVFQDDSHGYLVMKRYDCDLYEYAFERQNPLSEENIRVLFIKICRGLKHLHRARIAHLDLKPENILLDLQTFEPYICDFGSAFTSSCHKSNRRRTRACIQEIPALGYRGTRKFSSPEISLNPNIYDPFRADIYSLGVILHVLTTGRYPKLILNDNGEDIVDFTWAKDNTSDKCFDLLIALTNPSPTERMSIDKVLEHPWIKGCRRKSIIGAKIADFLSRQT